MKATKKTAKKLSASQLFTVISVTRAEIAEALNNAADNEDYNGNPKYKLKSRFTSTDPRLTDSLCKTSLASMKCSRARVLSNESECKSLTI